MCVVQQFNTYNDAWINTKCIQSRQSQRYNQAQVSVKIIAFVCYVMRLTGHTYVNITYVNCSMARLHYCEYHIVISMEGCAGNLLCHWMNCLLEKWSIMISLHQLDNLVLFWWHNFEAFFSLKSNFNCRLQM